MGNTQKYRLGQSGETTPRTVTEADLVHFACLTGDYSRLHMDRHFASRQAQSGRVVHGLLGASWALGGLSLDAPRLIGRGNPRALIKHFSINYRQPLLLGDTLRTAWCIEHIAGDRQAGEITTGLSLKNHRDEIVADGQLTLSTASDLDDARPHSAWPLSELTERREIWYLEDYSVNGQAGHTEGRTLTESDLVAYAGFSGDYNPQQTDSEFARSSLFRQRVAHPMQVFNIAFASWLRQWLRLPMPDAGFAGHLSDSWQFIAPVYIGDTLHCRYRTLAVRHSRSRPGLGLLEFGLQVVNQHQHLVQQGQVLMMVPARASA